MIIFSQDQKSIYNLVNIKSIDVVGNEIFISYDILSDRGTFIGKYATEERAKEILTEIVGQYSLNNLVFVNEFSTKLEPAKYVPVYFLPEA